MMIDTATAIMVHNLVEYTAKRLGITHEEAKAEVLKAAQSICRTAPRPVKFTTVKRPAFAVIMSYGGAA